MKPSVLKKIVIIELIVAPLAAGAILWWFTGPRRLPRQDLPGVIAVLNVVNAFFMAILGLAMWLNRRSVRSKGVPPSEVPKT